jgi:YD repeat-containing protein
VSGTFQGAQPTGRQYPNGTRATFVYDSVGNRDLTIDVDGGRFTNSYEADNRRETQVNPQGDRTSYSYDAAGRRTLEDLYTGGRASMSYDAADNLTFLTNFQSDNTVISRFDYEYDNTSNRTSVLEVSGDRVTWTYDDTYQLLSEQRSGANVYAQTYTYDPAGNRTVKNVDTARTTTTYDTANQIDHSINASGRTTYTFDANGNQQIVEEPSGDPGKSHVGSVIRPNDCISC